MVKNYNNFNFKSEYKECSSGHFYEKLKKKKKTYEYEYITHSFNTSCVRVRTGQMQQMQFRRLIMNFELHFIRIQCTIEVGGIIRLNDCEISSTEARNGRNSLKRVRTRSALSTISI